MSEPLDLEPIKARYLGPGFDDAHHPDVTIAALVAEVEQLRAALMWKHAWLLFAIGRGPLPQPLGAYSVPSSPEEES